MGIKEKIKKVLPKESIRKTAEKITEGKKEPQHLGNYSPEMVQQEVYSLQNTKPAFRAGKWNKRFDTVKELILLNISHGKNLVRNQELLRNMELIFNER